MTKKFMGLIAVFMTVGAPVDANPVERACIASDRSAATHTVCACVGGVARTMLSRSEQRRAARFFSDPDEAQEVRMSDNSRDEAFWLRYREFGAAAERHCS